MTDNDTVDGRDPARHTVLRRVLSDRAAKIEPSPDAWERFVERAADPAGAGAGDVVRLTGPAPARTGRLPWSGPARIASAAAIVVLVATGAFLAVWPTDDASIESAGPVPTPTDPARDPAPAVAAAPAGAIPPDPGRTVPGYGGDPVFGVGAGFDDPDAAAGAYLLDRIGAVDGLVVDPAMVDEDTALVRWANFERPVGGGPISSDPMTSGTVLLWRPDGAEWVIQGSLLDQVAIDTLVSVGPDVLVSGSTSTEQMVQLDVRDVSGTAPIDTISSPGPAFDLGIPLPAHGGYVLAWRVVGGATLGIAEVPVTTLGSPVGPVVEVGSDPHGVARSFVGEEMQRRPGDAATDPDGGRDFSGVPADRIIVSTDSGVVVVVVARVEGGIAVVAAWDLALEGPKAAVTDGNLDGEVTVERAGSLDVEVRGPDGPVYEGGPSAVLAGLVEIATPIDEPALLTTPLTVRLTFVPGDGGPTLVALLGA